ncbi:MAG: DMT family transporter [Alphaproteobacteria bacterium]
MPVRTADPRGVAVALGCALSYGIAPSMARLAYDAGADIPTATTARFVAGVLAVGLLVWLTGTGRRLSARANWGGAGLGVLSTVTSLGYMGSIYFIPASLAVLIFFTFPLVVALGARWTEGEPIDLHKLAGLAVAFCGLTVALGVQLDGLDPRGVALACAASVGAATHILAISRVAPWAAGAILPLTLRSMAVALAFNLLLLGWHGGPTWPHQPSGWVGLAGTMVFFTLGVTLMYAAVARLGPVPAAMLMNLEPLIAITAAVLLLGEHFGAHQVAGAGMVLGAVVWVQLRRSGALAAAPADGRER